MVETKKLTIAVIAAVGIALLAWRFASLPTNERSLANEPIAAQASDHARSGVTDGAPLAGERADARLPIGEPRASVAVDAPHGSKHTLPPLGEAECCIVGRVVRESGDPIRGARVSAFAERSSEGTFFEEDAREDPSLVATSDADGAFHIAVPESRAFILRASVDGLAPRAVGPAFAGQVLELVLVEGASLRVRVLAVTDAGESPAAGARITATARSHDDAAASFEREGVADDRGELVLAGLPAWEVLVVARAPGFAPASMSVRCADAGEQSCELHLRVPSAIEGGVIDRASGLPIEGAQVGSTGLGRTRTGRDGRYRLDGLAPDSMAWGLGASAPGYATQYEYVRVDAAGSTRTVDFELDASTRAHGRIVDSGRRGVAGARIRYAASLSTAPFLGETHRGETESDASGDFVLDDLTPDAAYRLLVRAERVGSGVYSIGPMASGAAVAELGELVITRANRIAGRSSCPNVGDGTLLVRATRTDDAPSAARGRHLDFIATSRIDPRGRFALDALPPGTYRLELDWRADVRGATERVIAAQSIDLSAGEDRLDVVLECGAADVRGIVVDPAGAGIKGCRVELWSESREVARAYTSTDGRFQIATTSDGPFALAVDDERLFHESRKLEGIRPGPAEIAITLEAFHSDRSIRGRLIDPTNPDLSGVYVAFTDTRTGERLARVALPDASGTFEMKNLRDVEYDLELVDFGNRYQPAKLAKVRPGNGDIELRLEPRE